MKISKIAIVALFAAGFLTTAASPSMATSCAEGYVAVETGTEPEYSCEPVEATEESVDVKPIDSCWTTEDGTDVCARGLMEPMPANGEEIPVDGGDCTVSTDPEGNELKACYDAVPYEATGEEGEGGAGRQAEDAQQQHAALGIDGEGVNRCQHPRAHQEGAEHGEGKGGDGQEQGPARQGAALFGDHGRVQQGRAHQPGHEAGVLDRIPEPPAAPAQLIIGPEGAEGDADGQEGPAGQGPGPHPATPCRPEAGVGPPLDQGGHRQRETDR